MFHESERNIPSAKESDVVVCGGGPAGVAAAIVAAGLMAWVIDSANKPGVMQEIAGRLKQRGACTNGEVRILDPADRLHRDSLGVEYDSTSNWSFDVEEMKLLLEEMCLEAGVRIRLHTHVVGAYLDPSNRLSHVITESKSGREAWPAQVFVDTTGDGDVGALAGCGFDLGREGSGEVQPMSLGALVTGIQAAEVEDYVTEWRRGVRAPKKRLLSEIRRAGQDC